MCRELLRSHSAGVGWSPNKSQSEVAARASNDGLGVTVCGQTLNAEPPAQGPVPIGSTFTIVQIDPPFDVT